MWACQRVTYVVELVDEDEEVAVWVDVADDVEVALDVDVAVLVAEDVDVRLEVDVAVEVAAQDGHNGCLDAAAPTSDKSVPTHTLAHARTHHDTANPYLLMRMSMSWSTSPSAWRSLFESPSRSLSQQSHIGEAEGGEWACSEDAALPALVGPVWA